mmetsp:Transcript_35723/g.118374  ORF Transcript_35723/g.118374 Transcript_35723/m.118374 type:complete len:308 (+) Transcript_35723:264-1187(+)
MGHSRRPDHHAESELIVLLLVVELAGEHQVHVWVDPLLERGAAGRVRLYQPLEGGLPQAKLVPHPEVAKLVVVVLHFCGEADLVAHLALVGELDVSEGARLCGGDVLALVPPLRPRSHRTPLHLLLRVVEALATHCQPRSDALHEVGAEEAAAHVGGAGAAGGALVVQIGLERLHLPRRLWRRLRLQPRGKRLAKLRVDPAVETAAHVDAARNQHALVAKVGAELVRRRHLRRAQKDVVVQRKLWAERLVELEACAVEDVGRENALRLAFELLKRARVGKVGHEALQHRDVRARIRLRHRLQRQSLR